MVFLSFQHSLAYDYSNVTVEAYMASVIALESEAVSTRWEDTINNSYHEDLNNKYFIMMGLSTL